MYYIEKCLKYFRTLEATSYILRDLLSQIFAYDYIKVINNESAKIIGITFCEVLGNILLKITV